MNKNKNVFHINTKIMILVALVMIIFGGTIFALMYRAYADHEVALMGDALAKSARAISSEINGDQVEIYAKTLKEDDQYEELFNLLSDFKTAYEYTFIYVMAELDAETYVYIADGGLNREHTEDLSLLGDTDLKEDYGEEPELAIQEDRAVVTTVYDNGDWGHMLSAFAPVKNTAGEIVGVIGVDMSSEQVGALTSEMMKPIFITIVVVTIVMFLFVYLISGFFIRRILTAPLGRLRQATEQIAAGSLDVKLTHKANDEIGQLAETFNGLIGTLQYVFEAVNQIKIWAIKGELRNSMEEDERIRGKYHDMIQGMNHIMEAFTDHLDSIPLSLKIVDPDYRVLFMNRAGLDAAGLDAKQAVNKKCYECLCADECRTDKCPGAQAISSGQMRECEIRTKMQEMQSFASPFTDENGELLGFTEVLVDQTEIKNAERKASEDAEKMENQMELARKQADYQKKGISTLIDSLEQLARGDLNIRLNDMPYDEDTKEIHDSFYQLEKSLVDSCAAIKGYIDELDDVLAQLADKNLDVEIERDYKGDFSALKESINHIIRTLNDVFSEILVSSGQVESAAAQVSDSAQSLSHGASEQASAIEEISATVSEVAAGTRKNAEDANKANGISYAAKEDAQTGNRQMGEMIAAMEAIKESSKAIANIIKVIDDIAFQTNILALNAAVEAARAGEQGKGFAVVAGEVRNLAVRSAAAAKETTELIDTSLARVEAGAKIADNTATALAKIVDGVTNTVDIIATIAEASAGQAASIGQINNGVEQISNVTQSNTATAEASASTSEQMAAQTQVLQNMMREFRLRKESTGNGIKLLP